MAKTLLVVTGTVHRRIILNLFDVYFVGTFQPFVILRATLFIFARPRQGRNVLRVSWRPMLVQDGIMFIVVYSISSQNLIVALKDNLAIRRSHSVHLAAFAEITHAKRAICVDKFMLLFTVILLISSLLDLLGDRSRFVAGVLSN